MSYIMEQDLVTGKFYRKETKKMTTEQWQELCQKWNPQKKNQYTSGEKATFIGLAILAIYILGQWVRVLL